MKTQTRKSEDLERFESLLIRGFFVITLVLICSYFTLYYFYQLYCFLFQSECGGGGFFLDAEAFAEFMMGMLFAFIFYLPLFATLIIGDKNSKKRFLYIFLLFPSLFAILFDPLHFYFYIALVLAGWGLGLGILKLKKIIARLKPVETESTKMLKSGIGLFLLSSVFSFFLGLYFFYMYNSGNPLLRRGEQMVFFSYGFIFFTPLIFTAFAGKLKYLWIAIFTIPIVLVESLFEILHSYIPIGLLLIGWVLGFGILKLKQILIPPKAQS